MATFNFPHHTIEERYPESSTIVQFGRGYRFASKPKGPDQITFILKFPAMWFYVDETGALDTEREPTKNMAKLIEFYEQHRQFEKFVYPHPRRGNVNVRFLKPLNVPEVLTNMNGTTEGFQVELILEP